jgi:uncharacterized OsmC-like protein
MGLVSEVRYTGALRTEIRHLASDQRSITDAPKDNQGMGAAFSPTDLMATSLASCMLTIMGIRARDMDLELGNATARIEKRMDGPPRRVAGVRVDLYLPDAGNERERSILEAAARTCPVALSLHPELQQETLFHWGISPPALP